MNRYELEGLHTDAATKRVLVLTSAVVPELFGRFAHHGDDHQAVDRVAHGGECIRFMTGGEIRIAALDQLSGIRGQRFDVVWVDNTDGALTREQVGAIVPMLSGRGTPDDALIIGVDTDAALKRLMAGEPA